MFALLPTVMSGNSADSFSEDSEADDQKDEVKEKAEAMVKKKGPGRPPRKKRPPIPSPVSPSVANALKRRCMPVKSGNPLSVTDFSNKLLDLLGDTSASVSQGSEAC